MNRLHGPYFDFLVLDEYEITKWEEEELVEYVTPTYFHHPDALRVPDCIVGLGAFYFLQANPSFDFWRDTVYDGEDLDKLLMWLRLFVEGLRACREHREFERHAERILKTAFIEMTTPWQNHWSSMQDDVADCYEEIILLVREAQERKRILLVIGI